MPIQCVYIRITKIGTIVQRGLSNGKCLKDCKIFENLTFITISNIDTNKSDMILLAFRLQNVLQEGEITFRVALEEEYHSNVRLFAKELKYTPQTQFMVTALHT